MQGKNVHGTMDHRLCAPPISHHHGLREGAPTISDQHGLREGAHNMQVLFSTIGGRYKVYWALRGEGDNILCVRAYTYLLMSQHRVENCAVSHIHS
jgi:hypothetical protein